MDAHAAQLSSRQWRGPRTPHLGLKLVELAGALLGGDNLRMVAEPVLHELVARTRGTVHLGVPSDGHVVYIAKVESARSPDRRASP